MCSISLTLKQQAVLIDNEWLDLLGLAIWVFKRHWGSVHFGTQKICVINPHSVKMPFSTHC